MKSVLVVDDDAALPEMVSMVLGAYDIGVTGLTYGEDLVTNLRTSDYDLLLLDVYLGTLDGRELCKELKSSAEFERMPVILYPVADIDPGSIKESKADLFFHKPFDNAELIKSINDLVEETVNSGKNE